jgi:hypothetical protein
MSGRRVVGWIGGRVGGAGGWLGGIGRRVRRVGAVGGVGSVGGAALLAVVLWAVGLAAFQETPFPHEEHEGLFPVCTGCHAGIESGNAEEFYPEPAQCTGCHDGTEQEPVSWSGPATHPSNVTFDHAEHRVELVEAGDSIVTCAQCHADPAGGRMSVDASEELGTCWSCHAHEREEHFAPSPTSACETCHVPLAESGFDRGRLEDLPVPSDHADPRFLHTAGEAEHAAGVRASPARCATCHTQDRCAACHVDAGLEEIAALPEALTSMELPAWESEYPVPGTHLQGEWVFSHAPGTEGAAECSTCHTSNDCASCHLEPMPDVIAELPSRDETVAPGTELVTHAPATHATPFFIDAHSTLAAADPSTCATCHTESYCVDCHDGPPGGGYHEPGFVAQHEAEAFGRSEECASCHNTAAFCRECHQDSGLGARGRLGAGFHDAEPVWLLRHGTAARQSLESCASCHQQRDCVQCHGTLGAFRVSPHTDDFDAGEAWARSPRTCLACHISNPVGGVGG